MSDEDPTPTAHVAGTANKSPSLEHSMATGQKEWETTANETKFFQDFANSYHEDDASGDEIQTELADVAQKQWDNKLSSGKIKSVVEKYKQPQNCSDIKGLKVNPEI